MTNKKQRRNGTLQSSDTLTLCLLIVQLWSGVLITHWNRVWGEITSDERAVNGPGPG
ncbi:rpoE leader peptide RseD [Pseudocitrobacter cyperus]|uniref:rpoE leader peptide RseD n=1 Tax=Pseudocitrobacter cyperus TaxID=3112843 RepID=UPI00398C7010